LFIKDNECSTNIVAYKKVYVYTTDGEEVILGISWFSLKNHYIKQIQRQFEKNKFNAK
jgi:hypothetical protein